MKNTRIFLVRHAESVGNKKRVPQGQIDYALTPEGVRQAKAIAKRLSKIRFDAIYASTLTRACRTAEEIAKLQHCKVVRSKLLMERSFGKHEGRPYPGVGVAYRYNSYARPPGGESMKQALDRVKPLLAKILKKHAGKTILIVGHGNLGRATLCYYLHLPVSRARVFGPLLNTSITEIEFYPHGPRLMRLNDWAKLGE